MNISQLSWVPLPSRTLSHGILTSRSLKRPNSALLKSRVVRLLCTLLTALRILNSTISWSLQPKAAFERHVPHHALVVGENKVQHSTSPPWLLCHLEKDITINALQEPAGLLMPAVLSPQQISEWLKSPMRSRACEIEAALICLQRALSAQPCWSGDL